MLDSRQLMSEKKNKETTLEKPIISYKMIQTKTTFGTANVSRIRLPKPKYSQTSTEGKKMIPKENFRNEKRNTSTRKRRMKNKKNYTN